MTKHTAKVAAPIQTPIIDRPFQVVRDGIVISHHARQSTAQATALMYPGSSVRYVGA